MVINLPNVQEKLLFLSIAGEGISSVQKLVLE